MPVLKLWCLPHCDEKRRRTIHRAVVVAVVSVKELGLLNQRDMTVLFPPDMMQYGLGTEIVIEVTGLYEKRGRNEGTRTRLAAALGKAVLRLFPDALVECNIDPYIRRTACWRSRK